MFQTDNRTANVKLNCCCAVWDYSPLHVQQISEREQAIIKDSSATRYWILLNYGAGRGFKDCRRGPHILVTGCLTIRVTSSVQVNSLAQLNKRT
jgi:hypothetical protein